MRAKAIVFAVAALFVYQVSGQEPAEQNVDRVFPFTHTQAAQDFREIGTVIRSVADIRQLSIDDEAKTLTVRGSAGQIAMAAWLFSELDKPSSGPPQSVKREYPVPGASDDVVRVFQLTHAETVENLQEMSVVTRSITEIRRAFTYNAARTMVLRGTVDQIATAEWLINHLDNPPASLAAANEYRMAAAGENVVRLFYLPQTETVQAFQETAVRIRSAASIRRAFTYNPRKALVLRGTAEQIAQAERLIKELDKP